MHIKEFDTVLLKDGRKAAVVEILDDTHFLVDVGESEHTLSESGIQQKFTKIMATILL